MEYPMSVRGSGTRCRVDVSILTTGYGAPVPWLYFAYWISTLRPPEESGVSHDVMKPVTS